MRFFFGPQGGFRLQDFGLRGGGSIAGSPAESGQKTPWFQLLSFGGRLRTSFPPLLLYQLEAKKNREPVFVLSTKKVSFIIFALNSCCRQQSSMQSNYNITYGHKTIFILYIFYYLLQQTQLQQQQRWQRNICSGDDDETKEECMGTSKHKQPCNNAEK